MCAVSFICCILISGWILSCDGILVESKDLNFDNTDSHDEETSQASESCEYLDTTDVIFLEDGVILIIAYNTTMLPTQSHIIVQNHRICFKRSEELKREIFHQCFKMLFDADEFEILPNSSVLLFVPQPEVLEPGTYKFYDDSLLTCDNDELYTDNEILSKSITPAVYDDKSSHFLTDEMKTVNNAENSVTAITSSAHLMIICIISSLRNLSGYNFAFLN
ncbi:uncharacterized protein LOC129976665 [Argiope bruennichi]|uniref:Uncharacterized protein n=1 Tax=Argiope bruennichi TaxID=94029 RepID=A0A8T0ERE1_ARGBR|nr:uncharacterized protein LOC129976665 [Argiope bruennichi]XP_055946335.1 uncharacterized protein LOC129976665 [Argiope bruennichi]KAF8777006.1 hypothetical protein HNY73_013936 [Argiope bruennichi]